MMPPKPDMRCEWSLVCLMSWLPRCSPWWSSSRMAYSKSKTPPLRHLKPGPSTSQDSSHWSSRWCCVIASWDQPRISYQARRVRWHSSGWQRVWCGPRSLSEIGSDIIITTALRGVLLPMFFTGCVVARGGSLFCPCLGSEKIVICRWEILFSLSSSSSFRHYF